MTATAEEFKEDVERICNHIEIVGADENDRKGTACAVCFQIISNFVHSAYEEIGAIEYMKLLIFEFERGKKQ